MTKLTRLTFDAGSKPQGLFVPADEIKVKVWHPFAPVWGNVVKYGLTSVFDEVTYGQMLDDAVARGLCIYMDQDHASAHACWSMTHVKVPALAYYCGLQVNHEGKLWRRVNLAGHSCADSVDFDPAGMPEGLAGFLCSITKDGKEVLQSYQALSIDFNPFGEDYEGHPVGQVLNCVSAVNGPHLPGAGPPAGRFNREDKRYFDMATKKKRLFALAKDDAAAGDGEAETKDLSAEMSELAKELGMPEGSAPESIIGAALAVIKAGKPQEPDGDEPLEGDNDGEQYDKTCSECKGAKTITRSNGDKATCPTCNGTGKEAEIYARLAARFSRPRRLVSILAKELGTGSTPRAVLRGYLAHKAKSVDGGEFARLKKEHDEMVEERKNEKALARDNAIKAILKAAGPTNEGGDGRISQTKADELYAKANKYGMSPEDVASWLPTVESQTFTQNGGPPNSKAPKGNAGSDRMVGAEHATQISSFRDQYQKDTGKRLLHSEAGKIVASFARSGGAYSYEKAKEMADRLSNDAFLKEGK